MPQNPWIRVAYLEDATKLVLSIIQGTQSGPLGQGGCAGLARLPPIHTSLLQCLCVRLWPLLLCCLMSLHLPPFSNLFSGLLCTCHQSRGLRQEEVLKVAYGVATPSVYGIRSPGPCFICCNARLLKHPIWKANHEESAPRNWDTELPRIQLKGEHGHAQILHPLVDVVQISSPWLTCVSVDTSWTLCHVQNILHDEPTEVPAVTAGQICLDITQDVIQNGTGAG